jgi:TolB-like protein/DNA-binding winged helix-turn-helix (wHTH) protein/Tfp pilus assembly protein PilF
VQSPGINAIVSGLAQGRCVPACVHKFEAFELDPSRFELRRNGRVLKLERIPMELLILLLEKDGSVVTRQEIVDRLWGKDVFVDTEHGINTAIRKIRQALKDDSERPRFVQTITGKGYRFIAEKNGQAPQSPAVNFMPAAPPPMWGQPPRLSSGAELPRRSPSTTAGPRPLPAKIKVAIAIALTLAAAATLAFAFRARLFPSNRAAQIHSIAVIPLANLSGDSSQEYFADGMTDELITALAKNHNLRVVSRTSAMQYKGVQRPLPEIARELGVDGILEGSIERTAARVHMTVQLIYAPTDSHVWAESYDRDLNQAFSLPEELSETIAKEVKTATSSAPRQRYINPEAHDAYLRGRYFWFNFNLGQTLPYFEKAIQLQPDYAAAWSGLADTYAVAGMGSRLPQQVSSKAFDAARKALELDDSLPEAHNSMAAWYLFYGWDLQHADSESKRAVELNPNYAEGHCFRHKALMVMNRLDEAKAEEKRAVELDPFARPWGLGAFYTETRQYDAAINELLTQHAARPTDDHLVMYLSKVYWLKGMYKESQQELEEGLQLEHDQETLVATHKAWVQGGEQAVEQRGLESIQSRARKSYVSEFNLATATAYTSDKDQTLKHLEASYRNHDPGMIEIQHEPLFDFLHSDPRYQALIKTIGLTPDH